MLSWLFPSGSSVILTIPHSGEVVPVEASWLHKIPKKTLLTDVDRFVDRLYAPAVQSLRLSTLMTQVHRYAVDLNRYPEDVDRDSVEGSSNPAGAFPKGFHWVMTTQGERLMPSPIPAALHQKLVALYHDRFHAEFTQAVTEARARFPGKPVFHLDCHSMPSVGTAAHRDQGEKRADVVISDCEGKSASGQVKDLVVRAFQNQGFEVAYNWPYTGGRITQKYGRPRQGHETIQIELNRALYMDEETRLKKPEFEEQGRRLQGVLQELVPELIKIVS